MNSIKSLLTILIFCPAFILSQNSYLDWFIHGGGASNEVARDVYVDNFGYIYFVSEVTDTTIFADTTFVANFADVCLVKLNPDGDIVWIRLMGGAELDRGLDIKTDNNDDIIVTGFFGGSASFGDTTLVSSGFTDVFIVKYNPNGVLQWVVQGAGPNHDEGLCIAIDILNDIYIGGYFESALQIGSFTLSNLLSYETMFCTKVSSNGNVIWAEQAYTNDYSESSVESICFDGFDLVLTGVFDDTMIFQSDTLVSMDGSEDVFIAKVDLTGNKVWLKQTGGDYDDGGRAIISDGLGNLYLAGYFTHTANFGSFQFISTDNNDDVFIAGLDAGGNFIWAKHGSGPGYDYPTSISYNSTNGISICGITTGGFSIENINFSGDATDNIFAANYSVNGNLNTVLYAGGLGEERIYDIYLDDNNDGFFVGSFSGSMEISDTTITALTTLTDLYIGKVNFDNVSDLKIDLVHGTVNEFLLSQNYPNPFNPSTTINWEMPQAGYVTLKIYDVLGREVITLVNEELNAGKHEVVFDAQRFSSGIYFYQLKAGSFVGTKKMLYLK